MKLITEIVKNSPVKPVPENIKILFKLILKGSEN